MKTKLIALGRLKSESQKKKSEMTVKASRRFLHADYSINVFEFSLYLKETKAAN